MSDLGATRRAVIDFLLREADMDGLVIVSEREIGEVVGVSQGTASYHIRKLVAEGLLTAAPAVGTDARFNAIQLTEAVLSA